MKVVGIGVADIRTEPKFESERDSQLIFGEEVNVLSDLGDYSLVDCGDRIRGYIKSTLITEGGKRKYKLKSFFSGETVKLPFGSYLSKDDVDRFNVPENLLVPIEKNDFDLISLAMKFLGVPYLWGGTSDFGFDCSGFVQRLFKFVGIVLPRNADWQRDSSETVKTFEDARPSDLVFFHGHVAIYLGKGKIIHANGHSASVSINDLFDNSEYSRRLLDIFEKIGRIDKTKKIS